MLYSISPLMLGGGRNGQIVSSSAFLDVELLMIVIDYVVKFVPKTFFKRDNAPPYRHKKHYDGNNTFGYLKLFFNSIFHKKTDMPKVLRFNKSKVLATMQKIS